MLVDPVPDAEGRELLEGYSANPEAQGLHTNLIHYGFALFAPVAYAMVGLARGRGAWLANAAGVLAVLGLSTLPGLVLLDHLGVGAVRITDVETAFRIQEETENLPGFIALIAPARKVEILRLPPRAQADSSQAGRSAIASSMASACVRRPRASSPRSSPCARETPRIPLLSYRRRPPRCHL